MHKIINGQAPPAFVDKFAYVSGGSRDAERCNLYIPRSKTHKSFLYLGAKCWDSIAFTVRTEGSTDKFCKILKASFLHDVTSDDTNYRANNQFDLFHTSNIQELEQI